MRHYAPFHLFLELTDTAHVWTRSSYDKNYWQLEWNPYLSTFKCSSKYFIIQIEWNQFNNISYNFTIVILFIESSPRWSDVEWLIANRLWLSSNTTFFIRKKNFWMFWIETKTKKNTCCSSTELNSDPSTDSRRMPISASFRRRSRK